MKAKYDLKKEWPRLKKELVRVSQEAMNLAKKGEKEIVKISKKGKLHVDVTALTVKKEQLFHLIGKEYVKGKCPPAQTPKIKKLVSELNKLNREITGLRKKIKTGKSVRKRVSKKAVKRK